MQRFDSLYDGNGKRASVKTKRKALFTESLIVGVTDDRGVEKCAYVICRYLVECKSYSPDDAIKGALVSAHFITKIELQHSMKHAALH